MKLTKEQAKQVIEYFGAQAAEDAPEFEHYEMDFCKHAWQTRLQLSLLLEKAVPAHDWYMLIVNMMDLQSFDRDKDGYLHQRGYEGDESSRDYMTGVLEDLVSWGIDSVYNNLKVDW